MIQSSALNMITASRETSCTDTQQKVIQKATGFNFFLAKTNLFERQRTWSAELHTSITLKL